MNRFALFPCLLVATIYVVSSQSEIAAPDWGFSYDKMVHFLVFGLLSTAVMRIPYIFKQNWKGLLLTLLTVSSYGVIDEFRQMFTAGRSVDFYDWVADTSGALLASILYLKCNWYRRLLETKLNWKKAHSDPAPECHPFAVTMDNG